MDNDKPVGPLLRCSRCGATWRPRADHTPKKCPKCQNPNWNRPIATPLELLGPPPPGMTGSGDKRLMVLPQNLSTMRATLNDALASGNYVIGAAAEVQAQARKMIIYAASALEILDTLLTWSEARWSTNIVTDAKVEAAEMTQLQTSPPAPAEAPPEQPTTEKPEPAAPTSSKHVHKNGRKKKAKK